MGNYASFNMSPFSGDNPWDFAINKQSLCEQIGVNPTQLIIPYQIHGTEIKEIDERFFQLPAEEKTEYLNGVDALFTRIPQVCIGVTTADCVPLVFFDPTQKAVAVAHAGWRGTCAGIAEKTVQTFVKYYNSNPADIRVTIGPSISADVYEVGEDVVRNFDDAGFDISTIVTKLNGSFYLDLWKANQLTLKKGGILAEHIEIAGICTFTQHEQFFSARRLGIKSGRMLSGIMLKGKL